MDDADRAQMEMERAEARYQAIRDARPVQESRTECVDCGQEIHAKRRLAARGCTRCAECQDDHEREVRR
jgi:RNA polymerase-binding transcription factor DksA